MKWLDDVDWDWWSCCLFWVGIHLGVGMLGGVFIGLLLWVIK